MFGHFGFSMFYSNIFGSSDPLMVKTLRFFTETIGSKFDNNEFVLAALIDVLDVFDSTEPCKA